MSWTVSEGVNYECACETINHVIALHTTAIDDEEHKAEPDLLRIAALEDGITGLVAERQALSVTDPAGVQKSIDRWAPFVRARVGKPKVADAA